MEGSDRGGGKNAQRSRSATRREIVSHRRRTRSRVGNFLLFAGQTTGGSESSACLHRRIAGLGKPVFLLAALRRIYRNKTRRSAAGKRSLHLGEWYQSI